MRNFLVLTAVTSMAMLSGCSDSNASQRANFPKDSGDYVQLYKVDESGPIKIEVARVDAEGKQKIAKGVVDDSGDHLSTRLFRAKVTFENCGVYKLDQPDHTSTNVYFEEVGQGGDCELGYMPERATRITARQ